MHLGPLRFAIMSSSTIGPGEAKAREVLESIATEHGRLATTSYKKDTRFVLELLQTADNSTFEKAKSSGNIPYISFRVYDTRIVVDCNQDGFLEENVRAICGLGTKRGSGDGYVGEEGIGFKFVFNVAWKLHIQSGDYSFCLKHRPGESGTGMISPEWEEYEPTEAQEGPLARMTLFLHEWDSQEARDQQRQTIRDRLQDLQPEMLIFFKKLQQIKVEYFDDADTPHKVTSGMKLSMTSARPLGVNGHVVLEKRVKTKGVLKIETVMQEFHVTRFTPNNTSKSESTESSTASEQRTHSSAATNVVLAFPLSEDSTPISLTETREIFALFPVSHVGFSFLINANFDTTTNRDSIVTSSAHNQQLRSEIVSTFLSAVEAMLDHPKLRYQWMRYLPDLESIAVPLVDPFWEELVSMLKETVTGEAKIFTGGPKIFLAESPDPRKGDRFALGQLWHLPPSYLDQHNAPLFNGLGWPCHALYISSQYQAQDIGILRSYGLRSFTHGDIMLRIKADLEAPTSRMRSTATSNDWHSRAANLLCEFLEGGGHHIVASTRALRILPVSARYGRWISINTSQLCIYLPFTAEGVSIPQCLEFCVLDSAAAMNPERKQLFVGLGVKTLSSDAVRNAIFKHFMASQAPHILITTSVSYLRFLYTTHPHWSAVSTDLPDFKQITLQDSNGVEHNPHRVDIYIATGHEYGPDTLQIPVKFISGQYLTNAPEKPCPEALSWVEWLVKWCGVLQYPRLFTQDMTSFSKDCCYLGKHRPNKFVGFLRLHSAQLQFPSTSETIVKTYPVLCEGSRTLQLKETVLPTESLKGLRAVFMEKGELFPFLELDPPLTTTDGADWKFLDKLGVVRQDDLSFYMTVLAAITNTAAEKITRPSRILYLYKAIYAKWLSGNVCYRADDQESIR